MAELLKTASEFKDVFFVRLPFPTAHERGTLTNLDEALRLISERLQRGATVIVFGDVSDLIQVHRCVESSLQYHLWVSIKREPVIPSLEHLRLTNQHVGALVYTKYFGQLQHTKTRLAYTYCPACDKTTKDYGGKKHTYHPYGTLISDVWRDVSINPNGDIASVVERFADLFGLQGYHELRICDLSAILTARDEPKPKYIRNQEDGGLINQSPLQSALLNGDVLKELKNLPDNAVDFVFADPPYNLKKQYRGYADDLEISDYFAWCDNWIYEAARVLRPGGTLALLNIPLWAVRHFMYMDTILEYQNWIVWDALSFPVRLIMPAHYAILCFSKGEPRALPGLTEGENEPRIIRSSSSFKVFKPLGEEFCLRSQCIAKRTWEKINDRGVLTDIWWDIHRLKHNARRVDHPCQLPPQLMYRLISLFTAPGEIVLDCFNGAGTTTLAAHQLGRRYIGIELEQKYHRIAEDRHHEIEMGLDPFRKEERELTAKNSSVARVKKQKYDIPKKTLQLEVRRVAILLDHVPSREEMIEHGKYSIHYYDEYFVSWGEVCAAARASGMSETRDETTDPEAPYSQKRLF